MINHIYVYDRRKYFFIFLKKKLSKKYNFNVLNDVEMMKVENFDNENIGIFIVNNVNDIVAFFRFRECFNSRVILCTENISIYEKYRDTFNIPCLDISKPKKQFYDNIKDCIEYLFEDN